MPKRKMVLTYPIGGSKQTKEMHISLDLGIIDDKIYPS